MRYVTLGMMVALLLALLVGAANAQPAPCSPRDVIAERLSEKYGEVPIQRGIALEGAMVVELFASPAGSWSLVTTNADGVSCLLAAGQDWESLPLPVPGKAT